MWPLPADSSNRSRESDASKQRRIHVRCGHPESGDIQGMTPEYFIQTMKISRAEKEKIRSE
ncbi:MAG: hypothetical protein DMG13_13770 [Acidobacteria bacterium]|nr:MAG: hypothetical protein DMG13_13770 [Acidobacteriota bacterium]